MRHDPAAGAIVIVLRSLKMYGMTQAVTDLIEAPSLAALHRFTRVPDNAQRAADAGHRLATAKAVTLS